MDENVIFKTITKKIAKFQDFFGRFFIFMKLWYIYLNTFLYISRLILGIFRRGQKMKCSLGLGLPDRIEKLILHAIFRTHVIIR